MDDLDRRLSDALGAQRLDDGAAARMARRAIGRPAIRWVGAAAAAALVAFAVLLALPGGAPEADAYTVVTRLDHVEVLAHKRTLPDDYVVPDGEFVRVGGRVAGPGAHVRSGRVEGDDRSAFLAGLQHFGAEQWSSAVEAFRAAGTPEARFYLIASLGRAHRYDEAVREAMSFLTDSPDAQGADLVRYWHAHHLRALGREEESRSALRELIERHPKSELVSLARAHLGNGASELWSRFQREWDARDYAGAAKALTQLIDEHPGSPAVNSGDADFYLIASVANAGDETRAIVLTDDFVSQHPAHSGCDYALYFKAVYLRRAGRLPEAREACRRIIHDHPRSGMLSHVRELLEDLQ